MGAVADAFYQEWQDYVVDGVPTSGVLQPSKAGARALGPLIESYVATNISAAVFANAFYHELIPLTAEGGAVSAGANAWKFRNCRPWLITEVRASLETAGSSATVIDVNVNGTSIMSAPVQIDAGALTSVGSAAPMAIATPNVLDDQEIEIDIDAAGTGALGLKVTIIGTTTTFGQAGTPYFVAAFTDTEAVFGGSTLHANYPASGILAGDIALLALCQNNGNPIGPSGWTAAGAQINQSGNACQLWYRLCDGTENGATVGIGNDGTLGGDTSQYMISIWRSCAQTGAPYEGLGENSGGPGGVMTGQSVVTTGVNRRVICILAFFNGSSPGAQSAGWTATAGGYNEISHANAQQTFLDAIPAPLVATVPADSRSYSDISSSGWASWSFALRG